MHFLAKAGAGCKRRHVVRVFGSTQAPPAGAHRRYCSGLDAVHTWQELQHGSYCPSSRPRISTAAHAGAGVAVHRQGQAVPAERVCDRLRHRRAPGCAALLRTGRRAAGRGHWGDAAGGAPLLPAASQQSKKLKEQGLGIWGMERNRDRKYGQPCEDTVEMLLEARLPSASSCKPIIRVGD